MNKTDTIKEWAIDKVGCPYIFAAAGRSCTPSYRKQMMTAKPAYAAKIKKYCPVLSGKLPDCDGCKYQDKPSYDCSGLSMEAGKLIGIKMPHGASSQWKGDYWDAQGPIDQMPMDRVCLVFNAMDSASPMGHVGIYLGNGHVVDARGHAYGVLHSPLKSYGWDHYAIFKSIKDEEANMNYLSIGNRGEEVKTLQTLLNRAGYNCGSVDGIFGPLTEDAVKRLQEEHELHSTGIVDEMTQAILDMYKPEPGAKITAKDVAKAVYEAIKNYL